MEESIDYSHYDLDKKASIEGMPQEVWYLHLCEHYNIICHLSASNINSVIKEHPKYFIKKSDEEIAKIEKQKADGLQRLIHIINSNKEAYNTED